MTAGQDLTGILGGTFDPVHEGHVAAARAACRALALDRVLLVPSHQPPHRPAQPRASAFHRFAMVSLAVEGDPALEASDIELQLPGPSYTADTLARLASAGYRASQLFFIIGTDAFAEIASWHAYPSVLDLAHFVVIARPGQTFDLLNHRLPDLAPRMRAVDEGTRVDAANACGIWLVNARTPDVSSTDVRQRAASGEALAGLVAPQVEAHIRKHQLYGSSRTHTGRRFA